MKKSALALAVAAAVGASGVATADTILYGSARPSVDWQNFDGALLDIGSNAPLTNNYGDLSDGMWDVHDNSSRLGVRGSEDLGGGLSAIYQFEFGVDMTDGGNFVSNRPKWVGLKGDSWGSVTAGTQWTAYYNVLGATDQFNSNRIFRSNSPGCGLVNPVGLNVSQTTIGGNTVTTDGRADPIVYGPDGQPIPQAAWDELRSVEGNIYYAFGQPPAVDDVYDEEGNYVGQVALPVGIPALPTGINTTGNFSANNCGTVYLGVLRYENSLMYTTPNWNGFSAQAMMVMNGLQGTLSAPDQSTDVDAWSVNIKYENGPWFAGVAYDGLTDGRQQQRLEYFQFNPATAEYDSAYRIVDPDTSRNLWGVSLGYNTDVWGLNFNYEYQNSSYQYLVNRSDPLNSPVGDADYNINNYYVVGRYSFGNNVIRLAYGYFNPTDVGDFYGNYFGYSIGGQPLVNVDGDRVQNFVVGWQYNFSKRTRAWVEYFAQDSNTETILGYANSYDPNATVTTVSGKYPYVSSNLVSVGMRHDF